MSDRLNRLTTFLRVAERGSLTAAARDLGVSQPTVTRAVATLETDLGTTLFHRTTHSLALTESGAALRPKARAMLAGWDDLIETMTGGDALSGPLHVVAPIALGQTILLPTLARFRRDHPGITINWQLTDDPVRLSETGADLWVRVGPVPDDTLIQRHVGQVVRHVLGVPRFADMPLEDVPWITLGPYEGHQIDLPDRRFRVTPGLNTNSIAVVARALLDGLGVAIAPDWYLRDALADGTLRRLAPAAPLPIHLAFAPDRRTKRLQALIDILTTRLAEITHPPPSA
ncbi:MAG: LysR family transcriptional regulator [Pseudomonadota bacterium]